MEIIERLDLKSSDIKDDQINKLKQLFPEAFTEGNKIDWDRLRLSLGENIDTGKERYGMNWPGKADCFRTIQQSSLATLVPDRDESVNFDKTENLFIEGDNLEVLKLLQKSYLGKIKMIYIDPPYNTGNDFIYPDNYTENLQTYLEYTGQVDSEGRKFGTNTDTDGRFHSKWMNMMYPRLFLAKNLLRDDGVIFISIDDNEVHNLKALCNEIFGEENFIANIIWEKKFSPQNDAKYLSDNHDHLLYYSKNKSITKVTLLKRTEDQDQRYSNPDSDPRGSWTSSDCTVRSYTPNYDYPILTPSGKEISPTKGRCWFTSKENFQKLIADNRIWFGSSGDNVPRVKKFLSEVNAGIVPTTIWKYQEVGHNQEAKQEINSLFPELSAFDTPKPTRLIKRVIEISCDNNSIILDFFSGSCTTAHAVIDLNKEDGGNRKFICVQLPEPTDENSEAFKAGYKSIADIGKERIRRVIKKINAEVESEKQKPQQLQLGEEPKPETNIDLGFKVFKLKQSNFKIWQENIEKTPEAIQTALELHIDHISLKAKQEAILFELLLKSGFELTTPIQQLILEGKTVFSVAEGQLFICLEKELTHELIKAMAELQPVRVICLDEGFHNNDQLKTNAVQIMKSKGVTNFRTV